MVISILGALYQRRETGKGARLNVGMQDAILRYIRNSLGITGKSGKPAPRVASKLVSGNNPPSNFYPCAPGGPNDYVYIYTSRANPTHWPKLLEVMGRKDLIGNPKFDTREARIENEDEVDSIISEWTCRRNKYEAMDLVGAAGIPAGAVRDSLDLMNDPDFENRRIMQTIQHPGYGTFTALTWPVRHNGQVTTVALAPLLGQNTNEVLKDWLDMTADQLVELNISKVTSA